MFCRLFYRVGKANIGKAAECGAGIGSSIHRACLRLKEREDALRFAGFMRDLCCIFRLFYRDGHILSALMVLNYLFDPKMLQAL